MDPCEHQNGRDDESCGLNALDTYQHGPGPAQGFHQERQRKNGGNCRQRHLYP
jgi:hypothetical protein